MTTLNDIKMAIISGQFKNDELTEISQAIVFARSQMTKQNTGSMVLGTSVKFRNKAGLLVTGEVIKVNRKFILVSKGLLAWRVPANMLELA
jgi:hypothetical protein